MIPNPQLLGKLLSNAKLPMISVLFGFEQNCVYDFTVELL
jgi:hypothetical protein